MFVGAYDAFSEVHNIQVLGCSGCENQMIHGLASCQLRLNHSLLTVGTSLLACVQWLRVEMWRSWNNC